jgi:hypothetical protein
MKSSFHRLIPFLPLFWSCKFRRLDPIQFLCAQARISAGRRLETRLLTLCCPIEFFFITTLHGPHGKHRLLLSLTVSGVFTAPLHSNGRGADQIENRLSFVEACLPSRCLAMGIHVTISYPLHLCVPNVSFFVGFPSTRRSYLPMPAILVGPSLMHLILRDLITLIILHEQ